MAIKKLLTSIILAAVIGASPLAAAEYIYLSFCPGVCELQQCYYQPRDTVLIFIWAPDEPLLIGAHFRLETDIFGPGDVLSIDPEPGAVIAGGSLFGGMDLSLDGTAFVHRPAVKVALTAELPFAAASQSYGYMIRDAMLLRAPADTLFLDDCLTIPGHVDCWESEFICWHPDTVLVTIGAVTTVTMTCLVATPGYLGTNIEVSDESGWVVDWNPKSIWNEACAACPWEDWEVLVSIAPPEEVEEGTISAISVYPTYKAFLGDSTSFFLRAVPPVAARERSWGGIKAGLRDKR